MATAYTMLSGASCTDMPDEPELVGLPRSPDEFLAIDIDALDLSDLRNWLPKQHAALLLNKTERTVERMVSEGKIEKQVRTLTGSGRKPMPVLNPRDVYQILKSSIVPRPHFLPPLPNPEREQLTEARTQIMASLPVMMERMVNVLDAAAARQAPAAPVPIWLDLEDACKVAGIRAEMRPAFKRLLLTAIKQRKLPALKSGRTVFIHRDQLFNFKAPE